MNVKRCQSIADNLYDKLVSIRMELTRDYQSGKYLNDKLSSIIWDSNVLKQEFDLLEKEQQMEEGETDEINMQMW